MSGTAAIAGFAPRPRWQQRLGWVIRLTVVLIACAGLYWMRVWFADPSHETRVQRVRLLNPAPPPPLPPPEQPKEEEKVEEVEEVQTEQMIAPSEAQPIDDRLGLDAEAEGAGDGFGLSAKPGGRDITTIGPGKVGAGGGERTVVTGLQRLFAQGYFNRMRAMLQSHLNQQDDLRRASYRTTLDLWIDPRGSITRIAVVRGSGQKDLDQQIALALRGIPSVGEPPEGLPQPFRILVTSSFERGL